MKEPKLIRLTGVSGIIAGASVLLLGLSFIVSVFVGEVALVASSLFLTTGKVFELFLLFGIFSLLYTDREKISLAALFLSVSGLMIDLFPPLGRILLLTGILLFAISSRRIKTIPGWALWLWLGGTSLLIAAALIDIKLLIGLGALASGTAMIVLGSGLSETAKSIEQPPKAG